MFFPTTMFPSNISYLKVTDTPSQGHGSEWVLPGFGSDLREKNGFGSAGSGSWSYLAFAYKIHFFHFDLKVIIWYFKTVSSLHVQTRSGSDKISKTRSWSGYDLISKTGSESGVKTPGSASNRPPAQSHARQKYIKTAGENKCVGKNYQISSWESHSKLTRC